MVELIEMPGGSICLAADENDLDILFSKIKDIYINYSQIPRVGHSLIVIDNQEFVFDFDGIAYSMVPLTEGGITILERLFSEMK